MYKIGIFNKSFYATQQDLKHGNGLSFSLFSGQSVTKKDIQAILDFNAQLQNNVKPAKAWATTMSNCSVAAQTQTKRCLETKGSLVKLANGFETMSFSAKASQVALKGLAIAGNMLVFTLIAEGLSFAVQKFDEYIHASETAREKSTELTDSWVSENDSINDFISKYEELREKLNDTSLSASEIKDIKENLLDVQNGLIEKYGQEALDIDLVNGKYDEQIAKLKELSRQKAQEYVALNYSNIQDDKEYISEKINLNKSLGFSGTQARPDDYSGSGFDLGKYLKRYDKLDAKVTEPSGQYGLAGTVNLVTNGTREEVYNQLTQLFNDLSNDFGESNKDVNKFKETLSGIIQDSFDTEQIEQSKSNIKKYAEAEILSKNDTRKLYDDAIIAVDKYNNALSSGKGIADAKKNLDDIKSKVKNTTSKISGAEYVFDDIYSQVNSTAESQYNIGKAFESDKSVKEYAEQLKGFTTDDLLKIDFKDNVQSQGEETFGALIDILGLSENEIQNLINKLVEFGYVQGEVQNSALNETTISTFSQAWKSLAQESKDELLNLAKAGEISDATLKSNADYKTLIKDTGLTAREARYEIMSMVSVQDKMAGFQSKMESIATLYNEFKDKGFVTAGTLNGLPDVFKEMNGGKDFDLFSKIAGDPTSGRERIKAAFGDIVTAYIQDQDILAGATEKNKNASFSDACNVLSKNNAALMTPMGRQYADDYQN